MLPYQSRDAGGASNGGCQPEIGPAASATPAVMGHAELAALLPDLWLELGMARAR